MSGEPTGWDIGFTKRELAAELTKRMGWGRGSMDQPLVLLNPLNTDQIADLLAAFDEKDREIAQLGKLVRGWQPVPDGAPDAAGKCFYCGADPCRCNEVAAVTDGVKREGVNVTD